MKRLLFVFLALVIIGLAGRFIRDTDEDFQDALRSYQTTTQ